MTQPFNLELLRLPEHSEILQLVQRCPDIEARMYVDGEYLILEQEIAQEVFIIIKGAFVVERSRGVEQAPPLTLAIGICEPSNVAIVGEMAYLGAQQRTASVRSSGASFTLCLKPQHLDVIMDGFPGLTQLVCRQFTSRLQESNNLIKRMQQALAMSMERKQFLEGDVLFRRGQDASRLYQLITGEVELIRSDASPVRVAPEHLLQGFLEPTPYLRCAPQDCTATALSPLMVIAIDQASRIAVVRNYPELVLKMLESV